MDSELKKKIFEKFVEYLIKNGSEYHFRIENENVRYYHTKLFSDGLYVNWFSHGDCLETQIDRFLFDDNESLFTIIVSNNNITSDISPILLHLLKCFGKPVSYEEIIFKMRLNGYCI
jgi:hypothetical protein